MALGRILSSRRKTEKAWVKVVEIKDPTSSASGAYLTGCIEQGTGYEKRRPLALIKRGDTFTDIKTMAPDYMMPMRCTGVETRVAFARERPDQFILNTAGTKYLFTS
jgi:hypothetical protein